MVKSKFGNWKENKNTNLNIFEMHFRILAKVDNGSQEVEQSLVSLEAFKQFY